MKIFSAILFFSLLKSVALGYTILKAESSPGFVMNPQTRTFVLDSSGHMTLTIKELRTGAARIERLGILSLVEMLKIKSDVASAAKATLMDERPKDPICADVPENKVSFYKSGVSKILFLNYILKSVTV